MGGLGLGVDGISGYDLNDLPALVLNELLALLGSEAYLALLDDGLGNSQSLGGAEGLLKILFRAPVASRGILEDILHRQDLLQVDAISPLQGQGSVRVHQDLKCGPVGLEPGGNCVIQSDHPYASPLSPSLLSAATLFFIRST